MEELLFKMNNLVGMGGLKEKCLSSFSEVVSGDECDHDIVYLFGPNYPGQFDHEMYGGHGYESDQSYVSFGSQSQEGFTDLEKRRKISKDSTSFTASESNSFDRPVESDYLKANEKHDVVPTPAQFYRTHREDTGLYHSQSSDLRIEPKNLQSSSVTTTTNQRQCTSSKVMVKPLTRKPKMRPGHIILKDAAFDGEQHQNFISGSSTTSEEAEQWETIHKKNKTISKKHGYRKTLGIFNKSAVAPVSDDNQLGPTSAPFTRNVNAFEQVETSRSPSPNESSSSQMSSSYDDASDQTCSSPRTTTQDAFMFDKGATVRACQELSRPFTKELPPLSPSEPGFGINPGELYEAQENRGFEMDSGEDLNKTGVALPGLIGSMCV